MKTVYFRYLKVFDLSVSLDLRKVFKTSKKRKQCTEMQLIECLLSKIREISLAREFCVYVRVCVCVKLFGYACVFLEE